MQTIKKLRQGYILLAFSIAYAAFSCGNQTLRSINKSLIIEPIANLKRYKAVVIIPSTGCNGCISGAETFMIQNFLGKKEKNIFYILTGHESKKSAKIRFGSIVNNNNFLIDTTSRFSVDPYVSSYPLVLLIESGIVVERKEINPNTSEIIFSKILN